MKVFLTGSTGFVGQEIQQQLLVAGHQIRALVRTELPKSNATLEAVVGDTTDSDSLTGVLKGCDAVINLVGIIREFPARGITFARLHTESTRNILQAAKNQGVTRVLQMSANGTRAAAVTSYHQTKWAAEELVRQADLDWTIFRPSLIFGPNDLFVNMLADLIRKLPLVPVMGNGQYKLQPVSVRNVAEGFVKALENPASYRKTYQCGGPQAYRYDEVLDLIGTTMGKKAVHKLHQPLLLMKPIISLLQAIPQFPMTGDQLQMLLEENICDPTEWSEALQIELLNFADGIAEYVK